MTGVGAKCAAPALLTPDVREEREQRGARGVPGWLEPGIGVVIMRLIGALLAATAVGAVGWPHQPNLVYRHGFVVLGLVLSVGVALALSWVRRRVPRGRPTRIALWFAAVVIAAGGGVLGVWLADLVAYGYGWDARGLTNISETLSRTGVLTPHAEAYFSRFPNNVPLLALMNLCRAFSLDHETDMYTVYRGFIAVCLGVSLLLVFVLVRRLRGPWAAILSQIVVLGLVGCSPWMAVPYTDLPAVPPILGGVCLVVAGLRARRWWARLLALPGAGACFGVAYVVKSTPGALAFGVGCALLVALLGARPWRDWVMLVVATAVAVGAFFGAAAVVTTAAFDQSHIPQGRLDPTRTPPPSWWMALGLISAQRPVGGIVYGGYNSAMVGESRYLRGEELREWSDARLQTERDKFGGTWGLTRYEVNKQLFNWGDGMFYAWGEGNDANPSQLYDVSPTARAVQSWNHAQGDLYNDRASLTNGVWLALVLWAGLTLLLSRYRRDLLVLALGLLGIVAFTLLFQGRSRYLFAYVPLVVALAASGDIPGDVRRHAAHLKDLRHGTVGRALLRLPGRAPAEG